jgi:colanic acid biosynthesis glycosyl transferase WcaI
MVLWQQDIISVAIAAAATARLGAAGRPIGVIADRVERDIARKSKAIIAISDEFLSVLDDWGVRERTTVIPNWAPLPELPNRPRNNAWAAEHDLVGRKVVLYSGTLGIKHNPAVLVRIARLMQGEFPEGRVVVISEGLGRAWLAERKALQGMDNLLLLDYQPYENLPDVLGSADVLVAILEPSAGRYSVPSKVLTYLCAGRPIVAVIPGDNAAASVIRRSGGGVVVPPGVDMVAADVVLELLRDESRRVALGAAGRSYSEATFDVARIADRFESILVDVLRSPPRPAS